MVNLKTCECGKRSVVPPAPNRRMRRRWITRKGCDLCPRCWTALCNRLRPLWGKPNRAQVVLKEAA